MGKAYFTMQEIQTLKLYELPTRIYEAIISELALILCGGEILPLMLHAIVDNATLDNATLADLDQYVDIYKFVKII